MENLDKLVEAVKNSNIGAAGLANVTVGTKLQLKGVKLDDQRSTDTDDVYRVEYNVVDGKRTYSTGTDGYSALRCLIFKAKADAATEPDEDTAKALKALKESHEACTLWTPELAAQGIDFWKTIMDAQADDNSTTENAKSIHERATFECIAKAMTVQPAPVVDMANKENIIEKAWIKYCEDTEKEVPVFIPRCYSGFGAYTKALNANEDFLPTRNALLETALLPKYKKMLTEDDGLKACLKKNLLQQTPVFTVTIGA